VAIFKLLEDKALGMRLGPGESTGKKKNNNNKKTTEVR